ncbi:hypothetical protein PG995_006736 [Apiospora arundinis]
MSRGSVFFNNELFSDAKVTAGNKTWLVHRAILCSQSEYFYKAFAGHFLEATTSHLTIEGHDSKIVDVVLRFLYTGEVDFAHIPGILDTIDLFVAADYFAIESLRDQSLNMLRSDLDFLLHNKINAPLLGDDELGHVFYIARLAYTGGPNHEALRGPIEEFLLATDLLLTKDERFMQELKTIPEFSLDIVRVMGKRENERSMSKCSRTKPEVCRACSEDHTDFSEIRLIAHPAAYNDVPWMIMGICPECVEDRKLAQ